MQNITIEQLEQLAAEVATEERTERARLMRLVRAYARIVATREPKNFKRMPLVLRDEDGHWDSSFPPTQSYREHRGPRLIEVRDNVTDDVATTSGFYHEWRRVTEDRGLWIGQDGTCYGCEETGTGRLGQFAAHPGYCEVNITRDWVEIDEVSLDDLRAAEGQLRELAFPLVAARLTPQG